MIRAIRSPALWAFIICLGLAYFVGKNTSPTWTVNKITLDVHLNAEGKPYLIQRGKEVLLDNAVPLESSQLHPEIITRLNHEKKSPAVMTEFVFEEVNGETSYYQWNAVSHWRLWSLLPALVAILLCWVTREPVTLSCGRRDYRRLSVRKIRYNRSGFSAHFYDKERGWHHNPLLVVSRRPHGNLGSNRRFSSLC